MNSTRKMVEWLYSKGDNVSDFQKGLRFIMWGRRIRELMSEIADKSYKLKKWSLYDELTKK
jgi:hypothetical protein